jgi:hypothetical protein
MIGLTVDDVSDEITVFVLRCSVRLSLKWYNNVIVTVPVLTFRLPN